MGVNRRGSPYRTSYPSGPWIYPDGSPAPGPIRSYGQVEEPKPSPPVSPPGNPDPRDWKIARAHEDSGHLVIEILYPGCTNFEGRKILVFQDCRLIDLVNQKLIDPHFFEDQSKYRSPIARFVPTESGWNMACMLVKGLT